MTAPPTPQITPHLVVMWRPDIGKYTGHLQRPAPPGAPVTHKDARCNVIPQANWFVGAMSGPLMRQWQVRVWMCILTCQAVCVRFVQQPCLVLSRACFAPRMLVLSGSNTNNQLLYSHKRSCALLRLCAATTTTERLCQQGVHVLPSGL